LSGMPAAVEVSSEDYIVGGNNLTLTCRIGYTTTGGPYIWWRLDDVYHSSLSSASQFTEVDELTYPGISLVGVSQLNVTVPVYAAYLPKYSCSVQTETYFLIPSRFRHNNNYSSIYFYTEYTRTTPTTKVSCKYKQNVSLTQANS